MINCGGIKKVVPDLTPTRFDFQYSAIPNEYLSEYFYTIPFYIITRRIKE